MTETAAALKQHGPPCWKLVVCPGTVLSGKRFEQPVLVELHDYGVITDCVFPRFSLIDASKCRINFAAKIMRCRFNARTL